MRRAARVVALLGLAAGAAGLALWSALQPPSLPVPTVRDHVFTGVTLVEAGEPARPGRTLRVVDGRIASVEATSPDDAQARDLSGFYVAPGLIDMHVHYPPRLAVGNAELWSLLLLAHGVTTVRETGSIDGSVFAVREAILAGAQPGPRILACGAMLDGDPPSFPSNRVVRTPADARAVVRDQAERGADCIKVYNMLEPAVLAAIRDAASATGLPVIGHAPHSVSLETAGLVDLQHGTGVVIVDRERVGRFDFRAEDWESVDEARIAEAVRISLHQGIAHTPTLVNARMRRLLSTGDAGRAMRADTALHHLPRFWRDVWTSIWGAPFPPGDETGEALHDRFRERQAAMTAALHTGGVRVHAGTDTLMPFVAPGSSLHGELQDLARASIPEADVWRLATRDAGRSLGVPGLGTLDPGAPADLIFLRDDPRGGLAALATIEAVVAEGRLYRRSDLEAALVRYDAHFHGRLYDGVMSAVVRLLARSFAPG